jgi:murein DD-endopeptidase MepM/ murein hydrolase activator NlpD
MRPLACGISAWAALLAAGATLAAAAVTVPVTIEVRARAIAPGEPLRVDVVSQAPLAELEAQLFGRPIFMTRAAGTANGGERWSGFTMIDLDREPAVAGVEVRGRRRDGQPVAGTHAVTVARKTFPVEELSVAPRYVEPPPEVRARIEREQRELGEIYARRRAVPPPAGPFLRPVPGAPTSAFGTRRVFNGEARSPHPGLDLRAATGTPVIAAGPGRVELAQELYYSGNTVLVDHGGGLFTIYAHLSEIAVAAGDEIEAGAPIGRSGATGRVTGPHLHWGAKIGEQAFDPTALLDRALFSTAD